MKKIYINVPMKGRKYEDVVKSFNKMKSVAEVLLGEKVEVVNPDILEKGPQGKAERIWALGESIKKLATVDYVIRTTGRRLWDYSGVMTVEEIADSYSIPMIDAQFDYICPDLAIPDVPNPYKRD